MGTEGQVLETAAGDTRVIDLAGKTLLPGFVDSHGHTYLVGLQATTANLLPPPDPGGGVFRRRQGSQEPNGVLEEYALFYLVGKLADFVILSDDPLTVPQDALADIEVLETIKEGVTIYRRPEEPAAAVSSPAVFGLTHHGAHAAKSGAFGVQPVEGDGCFNPGLGALV